MTVQIRKHPTRGYIEADIIVRMPNGEEHRERRKAPVQTESGADRWARARERHLAMNGDQKPAAPTPTLAEFAERWTRDYSTANGNKASTLDAKERIIRLHLVPHVGSVPLGEIGDAEVAKIKSALVKEKKSAKTINGVLAVLSTMLKSAWKWKLIEQPPDIEKPKYQRPEMEFYDFDEYARLMDGARKVGPMRLAMVLLAGDAGLRRGEMIALEHGDVGPAEIVVRRSDWEGVVGLPKGNKIRRVPMTARLKAAIDAVRHLRGKRLLWQDNGDPVLKTTLQSWMEVSTKRACLPPSINVHKLRHTFCSHLAMRGAPAMAIKELAGHADLATTMRYMHLSPAAKDSAIRLLDGGGAGVEHRGENAKS